MDRELNKLIYEHLGIRVKTEMDLLYIWIKYWCNGINIKRPSDREITFIGGNGRERIRYYKSKHHLVEYVNGRRNDELKFNYFIKMCYIILAFELFKNCER